MVPKEVKTVMFNIKVNKSLGPDGIFAGLYQKFWSTDSGSILDIVNSTFINRCMSKEMSGTLIALIPEALAQST